MSKVLWNFVLRKSEVFAKISFPRKFLRKRVSFCDKLSRKCYILTSILLHGACSLLLLQSRWVQLHGCLICFETGHGFVGPNFLVILHGLPDLILNITRIRWATALLQLLNFFCPLDFGYFTVIPFPASVFSDIFAKDVANFYYFSKFP
jgi:hypothetical protein